MDATSYERATEQILAWASAGLSRYVSLCTVNQIMEARDSATFADAMRQADLVTSDGMPLVWLLRRLGVPHASRVYGPDLMPLVLHAAAREGTPVGFYGGSTDVLDRLVRLVRARFPELQIAYAEAPPFRAPTPHEDEHTLRNLNASRRANSIRGHRQPQAGPVDARSPRSRELRHDRRRSGIRFSHRRKAASPPMDAAKRSGMAVPSALRTSALMAPLPLAKSPLRRIDNA